MPYHRRLSAKMPDFDDEVTVVDVYDLASDIGKECEIIIEKYGPDAVTSLLPKVINALELLENLAVRNEKENQALQELTAKISQLENDKIEKAEYRQRFEKEIEAIEEQWRSESAELVTAVSRLQDENRRLRRTINAPADGTSAPPSPAREHDQEVLSRLSSTAEKQRSTLRHQELQLQEKQQLIESLTNQVEKLAQVSRDLRRKHKQMQNQMRLICEERSELTAIVQNQQRDIATLQQANIQNPKCAACGALTPDGTDDEDQSSRPTFSVRELRAILHERNELKLKLNKAEETLQTLQAEPQHDSGLFSHYSGSDTSPSLSSTVTVEEEEAPVQGPLPAEPDDAPWKRNIFASSLLSLISPWAHSRAARSHRSQTRWPRPVAPPPLPRRHSLPPGVANHRKSVASHPASVANKQRRHSEIKPSKMDLRQELMSLMNNEEVTDWLGNVKEKDERFEHDITLQRSISLDRGVDIFNYLQSIESDSSESVASSWSVDSERGLQYRSLEDIPVSHEVKSRRVSCADANAFRTNLGLSILRNSYKVLDMGSGNISPQIKKLQKTFSFKHSTDNFESSRDNLNAHKVPFVRRVSFADKMDVNRTEEIKNIRQRRIGIQNMEYLKDIRKQVLRNSINFQSCENVSFQKNNKLKLRRVSDPKDVTSIGFNILKNSYKGEFSSGNISPTILKLKKSLSLRSSTEISRDAPTNSVSDYSEMRSVAKSDNGNTTKVVENSYQKRFHLGESVSNENKCHLETNILKLYLEASNFVINNSNEESKRNTPQTKVESSNSSKSVDLGSSCFCRICREVIEEEPLLLTRNLTLEPTTSNAEVLSSNPIEISGSCRCLICKENEDRTSYLTKNLTKIFMKVVRRKLVWDENNNFTEGETISCVIQVLKLLFGLWLRHLDHKGTQSTKT